MSELATLAGDDVASLRERSADGDPAALPPRIGRFAVRGVLGRGGMSTVLDAYDEALDREIALKILHEGGGSRHGSRLVREAQALARLSHPNVVQVYEVGEVDGRTFIAMERIRGKTLQAWQAQRPTWQECVALYLQAGRGLAAAHGVGLIHRDFKPSNCIVDEEGQVRVLDFGLARERFASAEVDHDDDDDGAGESAQPSLSSSLTQTGAILGTLAYMPVEQLNGETVDERSDQFSLCASLYEALHGERPFDDSSVGALTVALTHGTVRPAPPGCRVPARLRRIVLRGLSPQPLLRWPSMDALLMELSRLIAPRRARWIALAVGGGLAVLGGGLWQQARASDRCQSARSLLDGAWDEARRNEVEAALRATDVPYAGDTWTRVEASLDGYAEAWVDRHREACEAGLLGGTQTEALTNLRMGCLSTRRIALREVVEVLAHADPGVAERAVSMVAGLPGLARCDDVEALQAELAPPEDPVVAAQVRALRDELAGVAALVAANRIDDAAAEVAAMVEDVESLDHPPLMAELALQRGEILGAQGHYPEAEALLVQAYALALQHGHEQVTAGAAEILVDVVGGRQARFVEGRQWGITALALAQRQGEGAVARTLINVGDVLLREGKYPEALDHHQRALAIRERVLGTDDVATAQALDNLGNTVRVMGRPSEALEHHRRALAIHERVLGPDHPQLASTLTSLGAVLEEKAEHEEALVHHRRALAIRERALGPEHPAVAATLINVGVALRRQDAFDESRAMYGRALAIFTKVLGPDHPNVAATRLNLGVTLERQGRHTEALEEFREAHAIFIKTVGADHPNVATVLDNMGAALQGLEQLEAALDHHQRALAIKERVLEADHPDLARSLGNVGGVLLKLERPAEALGRAERALAIFEHTWGPDHPEVGSALVHLGLVELALDRPDDARPRLERALVIFESSDRARGQLASTCFALARCLWRVHPPERARARALAQRARELHAELGPALPITIDEVDAWLAEHGGALRPASARAEAGD